MQVCDEWLARMRLGLPVLRMLCLVPVCCKVLTGFGEGAELAPALPQSRGCYARGNGCRYWVVKALVMLVLAGARQGWCWRVQGRALCLLWWCFPWE